MSKISGWKKVGDMTWEHKHRAVLVKVRKTFVGRTGVRDIKGNVLPVDKKVYVVEVTDFYGVGAPYESTNQVGVVTNKKDALSLASEVRERLS